MPSDIADLAEGYLCDTTSQYLRILHTVDVNDIIKVSVGRLTVCSRDSIKIQISRKKNRSPSSLNLKLLIPIFKTFAILSPIGDNPL
jgi:hypothetical protein